MVILSPLAGQVLPIQNAPDPVFAEKMLGDGLIVAPSSKQNYTEILSPIDGIIKTINPHQHAITIEDPIHHYEILLHIGLDTIDLDGEGFKLKKIKEGDKVNAGDPLLSVDLHLIRSQNLSDYVITLLLDQPKAHLVYHNHGQIQAGDPLFSIDT